MMELSPHFLGSPVGGAHLCSAFHGRTCVVGPIFIPHDGAYPFLEGAHVYMLDLDCRSAYRLQRRAVGWHVARPSGVLAEEGWLSCRLARSCGPLDQELSADIWSLGRVHCTCLTFLRGSKQSHMHGGTVGSAKPGFIAMHTWCIQTHCWKGTKIVGCKSAGQGRHSACKKGVPHPQLSQSLCSGKCIVYATAFVAVEGTAVPQCCPVRTYLCNL